MRKEVNQWIFCNYDLSLTKLHDYSFVGDSSFEKFRIRTKGEKLADKILKEKPLFQQAILDMINQKVVQKDAERKEREKRREESAKLEREKRKAADTGRENSKKLKLKGDTDTARIDEVPAAPLPVGEEDGLSDPEGSARMSMS